MNAMNEAFLIERKIGIGGSDMGAILGLSPYRTPLDVWLEKTGRAEPSESSLAMRFGSMAEQFVADEYELVTGRQTERYNRMLRHPDTPLIGHVDRLVIPDGGKVASLRASGEIRTDRLLECKTANPLALSGGDWGEAGTDMVPPAYLVQCAVYMALTGCALADLACLFGNQEFRIYTIARDPELEATLIEQARDWWDRHVVADVPPEPSTPDECRRLWPSHRAGKSLIVDVAVAKDVETLAAIKGEIKQLEAKAAEVETRVLAAFGDAEEITYMGRKLATWKQNKDSQRTDWKALCRELCPPADLVEKFTTTQPGARVLRLSKQEQ